MLFSPFFPLSFSEGGGRYSEPPLIGVAGPLCVVIEFKSHARGRVRTYMRDACAYARVRAARSLRRGRRITCPRHMSPWVDPLRSFLSRTPADLPATIRSRMLRQGFSAEQVAGVACACPVESGSFFFPRVRRGHATSRFVREYGGLRCKVSHPLLVSPSSFSPPKD